MKFTELKATINGDFKYSIFLLCGEEEFFKTRALKMIKDKYVTEDSLNFSILDSENLSFDSLVTSLNNFPFMSQKRLTLIKEFYPTKKQIEESGLKSYLENPSKDSLFVISNRKEEKELSKYETVCVVECEKAETRLIEKWIKVEFNKLNVQIDEDAIDLIIEYCQSNMQRIEIETQKLASYVGDNGVVTIDTVKELVSQDNEYKIYELTDCIAKKDIDKALSIINDFLSKGETEQRLMLSLYNYFRRLLHLRISSLDNSELARLFNIKEFAVKKSKEQAYMFSPKALKKSVDFLADCDYKIKNGQISQDEAFYVSLFEILEK